VVRDGFGRTVEAYPARYVPTIDTVSASDDGPANRTTMSFDGFDRPTWVVTPDGRVTQTVYEPRLTTMVNARGFGRIIEHDWQGSDVAVSHMDANLLTVLAATSPRRPVARLG
jgi:YD repeat-containing protein